MASESRVCCFDSISVSSLLLPTVENLSRIDELFYESLSNMRAFVDMTFLGRSPSFGFIGLSKSDDIIDRPRVSSFLLT